MFLEIRLELIDYGLVWVARVAALVMMAYAAQNLAAQQLFRHPVLPQFRCLASAL
jgi:hypothetical protein